MQNRSFIPTRPQPGTSQAEPKYSAHDKAQNTRPPATENLSRIFNTALVSTQAPEKKDFSKELKEVTQEASYKAILSSVKQLAALQGISEAQAAEEMIKTFRKIDSIWKDYVFQEGLDRIRGTRK
jgi:hypothetical protein